jgi:hypothetical protein
LYASVLILVAVERRVGGARLRRGDGTAASLVAGLERAGTIETATTSQLRYGPGRHDGVAAVREFRYVDDCRCLRYVTAWRSI